VVPPSFPLEPLVQGRKSAAAYVEGAPFSNSIADSPVLNLFGFDSASQRQDIRREMRRQRRSLSASQQHQAALALKQRLIRMSVFRNARRVGCYLANDGELDLRDVIARIHSMRKCCYLPVLDSLGSNRLWFSPWTPETPLQLNRFGIFEPRVAPRQLVSASHLDLLLMPLVGFDPQGNRLGMGGGFYDRSLAFLKYRHYWQKPHLYGVAHEFQCVAALQQASWDVPMHGVVTDQCVYRFVER